MKPITLRLAALFLLLAPLAALRAGDDGPIVGAIRWDGWYGEGAVTKAVEASLGQPKYHFRLPWFAQVQRDGSVRINGESQAIVEQELAYAAAARLNYWAVVDYWDEAQGMSIALNRYLAAKNKRGIRYCLVEEGHRLDKIGSAGWKRLVEHLPVRAWDTRPHNERPPFWIKNEVKAEPDPTPPAQQKPLIDGVTATPDELPYPRFGAGTPCAPASPKRKTMKTTTLLLATLPKEYLKTKDKEDRGGRVRSGSRRNVAEVARLPWSET